ncbi:MAG: DnaJ domain-containing protein [Vicinamibacterales bacterium]
MPPSFADVLEEALQSAWREPRAWTRPGAASSRPHPLLGLPPAAAAPWAWSAAYPAPVRPVHRLSEAQRAAVDRLAELGATLSAGFLAAELRREYRRLARRYHPDAHADAPTEVRASLADRFRAATDAYRCLATIFEPAQVTADVAQARPA